ncbi:hypothetical protein GGX14DRAFT_662037, partial [Mycena pura]
LPFNLPHPFSIPLHAYYIIICPSKTTLPTLRDLTATSPPPMPRPARTADALVVAAGANVVASVHLARCRRLSTAIWRVGDISMRCRLNIEVVSSGSLRPDGRAPQHDLKRRNQRATRASLQTLSRLAQLAITLPSVNIAVHLPSHQTPVLVCLVAAPSHPCRRRQRTQSQGYRASTSKGCNCLGLFPKKMCRFILVAGARWTTVIILRSTAGSGHLQILFSSEFCRDYTLSLSFSAARDI